MASGRGRLGAGRGTAPYSAAGASHAIASPFPSRSITGCRSRSTFTGARIAAPLELRMSRSSPGRYSLHDFAKNVYDVQRVRSPTAASCRLTRPDPYGWTVAAHGGTRDGAATRCSATASTAPISRSTRRTRTSTCRRRSCGRAASTTRPATLTFAARRRGARWQVATQLHPGSTPLRVHRAEPAVPDGQPDRVRAGVHPPVLGRRRARSVSRCITPAPTPSSTRSSRTSRRSSAEQGAIYGEYPGVRTRHLYVSRRLPSVGAAATAWSIATAR